MMQSKVQFQMKKLREPPVPFPSERARNAIREMVRTVAVLRKIREESNLDALENSANGPPLSLI